jgi:hypothetical protein
VPRCTRWCSLSSCSRRIGRIAMSPASMQLSQLHRELIGRGINSRFALDHAATTLRPPSWSSAAPHRRCGSPPARIGGITRRVDARPTAWQLPGRRVLSASTMRD